MHVDRLVSCLYRGGYENASPRSRTSPFALVSFSEKRGRAARVFPLSLLRARFFFVSQTTSAGSLTTDPPSAVEST